MTTTTKTVLARLHELEQGYIRDENNTLTKLREADVKAFKRARAAMAELLDATNTMGAVDPVMLGTIAGIMDTHRYLQGQGVPAILKAIGQFGKLAEQNSWLSDARNAHVVKIAEMLRDGLDSRIAFE
jgi:hypothetical protein